MRDTDTTPHSHSVRARITRVMYTLRTADRESGDVGATRSTATTASAEAEIALEELVEGRLLRQDRKMTLLLEDHMTVALQNFVQREEAHAFHGPCLRCLGWGSQFSLIATRVRCIDVVRSRIDATHRTMKGTAHVQSFEEIQEAVAAQVRSWHACTTLCAATTIGGSGGSVVLGGALRCACACERTGVLYELMIMSGGDATCLTVRATPDCCFPSSAASSTALALAARLASSRRRRCRLIKKGNAGRPTVTALPHLLSAQADLCVRMSRTSCALGQRVQTCQMVRAKPRQAKTRTETRRPKTKTQTKSRSTYAVDPRGVENEGRGRAEPQAGEAPAVVGLGVVEEHGRVQPPLVATSWTSMTTTGMTVMRVLSARGRVAMRPPRSVLAPREVALQQASGRARPLLQVAVPVISARKPLREVDELR